MLFNLQTTPFIWWFELILSFNAQWLVIEQEEYPDNMSQLQAVKRSKQGLERIFAKMGL